MVCKKWLHDVLCFVFQNGNFHLELYLTFSISFTEIWKYHSPLWFMYIHHFKIIPLFSCTLMKVGVNDLVKYVTVLLPLEVT